MLYYHRHRHACFISQLWAHRALSNIIISSLLLLLYGCRGIFWTNIKDTNKYLILICQSIGTPGGTNTITWKLKRTNCSQYKRLKDEMKNGTAFFFSSCHILMLSSEEREKKTLYHIVRLMKAIDFVAEEWREQNETTVLKTKKLLHWFHSCIPDSLNAWVSISMRFIS